MKRIKIGVLALLFTVVSASVPVKQVNAVTQSSITRSEAEKRAMSIINLTWTYSKAKNSSIDAKYAGMVEQPSQFKNVTTARMTGIPYAWGGSDSIQTSSYNAPWTNFLDAISKGAYAGNVGTEGGIGLVPGTAGLDCSGFVQAVFNIKGWKISTSTIFNQYFKKIALNDLRHMDILNYPGNHVVIFDRWGTKNGVYGAYTYEATTNTRYGGIQGTKRYFISKTAINTGYIPGRYIYIQEVAAPASAKAPAATSKPVQKKSAVKPVAKPTLTPSVKPSPTAAPVKENNAGGNVKALNISENAKSIQVMNSDKTVISLLTDPSGWSDVNYNGAPILNKETDLRVG